MVIEISAKDEPVLLSDSGLKRRVLLRLGTLIAALTGASAIGAGSAQAAPGDKAGPYIPIAEKAAPLGVATLDAASKIYPAQLPDFSATIATATASKIDVRTAIQAAIDYGQAEATRSGISVIPVGDSTTWVLDPSGSGSVLTGLDPEVGLYVTIAASAASGVYRVGRLLAQPYGGGRFVSFLLRRNSTDAIAFDLWGSLGTTGLGIATRWNKTLSAITPGKWYRVTLSTVEQSWAGGIVPAATAKLDLRQLTVMVSSAATGAGSISIADMRVHQGEAGGKIALVADDGTADTYATMFPKLSAYGFRAGVSVEHINIGNPGYCTSAQLKEMHDAGWDMYGHHRTDMTTLPTAQQRAVHEDAKTFKAANGLTNGARIWVWPGGLRNDATETIAAEYWSTMRRVDSFTQTGTPHVYSSVDPPHFYWTKNKTATMIKAKIDDIAHSGMSMVLTLHQILPAAVATEDITIATFDEVIAYIAESNVKVVPASEIWTH